MANEARDIWAEWLVERRSGGDSEVRRQLLEHLAPVRDKVLDRARLVPGETVLDVGCGDGLIAFGALQRGAGQVVFSDISDDLLELSRETAAALDLLDRCSFVRADAVDLAGIEDASVDVVTTRSVLIYVKDKAAAFGEFFRVLTPGGRLSLFEPINRFCMDEKSEGFWGYPSNGLADLAERVEQVYKEIQPPSDPMLDFDERDLIALAERAGFFPIELELQAEIRSLEPRPWHAFLNSSGNPRIPTIAEAIDRALTRKERERFTAHLRPLVEQGTGTWRMATAYMTATRPGC